MRLGIDTWSYSFACAMRDVKPARRLTAWDILARVREWGLDGAQVGLGEMPDPASADFEAFRREIAASGLFWEVSAGGVQAEAEVLRALAYSRALGTRVVRSFMEGFGIQFKGISLDDYVDDAIAHIRRLLPEFERHDMVLCLENHGGLRLRYLRRVLETIDSAHLGVCLDTGNPLLTLEDPLATVRELAPRTYTCHLKDWRLIRGPNGVIVRGCALGEGVVDLRAALDLIAAGAPDPDQLHLDIEAPQEYLELTLFTADFWRHHAEVGGADLEGLLRLTERHAAPPEADWRIASMRGEPEAVILAEEHDAIARSVRYCRETLQLGPRA
jgi:sugar phosphate isomerase/epimerase